MYFYQRLKDLRTDYDLKQSEISLILGITQQQYQLYESGKREMPMHLFIILSKYYNVSLDYLAGITIVPRTLDGRPYQITKKITVGNISATNSKINIKN